MAHRCQARVPEPTAIREGPGPSGGALCSVRGGMDVARARELAWIGGIDALRDMTRRTPAGVVHDEGGVALIAAGNPMPFLINAVARLDPSVPGPDVMGRAREFFGARGRGFTVLALVGPDDDLIAAAESAGLVAMGDGSPLMAIDAAPSSVEVPDGLRLEMASTPAHVDDVIDVNADGYAVYGMRPDVPRDVLSPPSVLLAPHVETSIVYDDEGPIATAQVLLTHGTGYVQWVAAKQRAFRRGAGGAATAAVTAAAFERGATLATLLASPMGAPLYRKLGWTDVGVSASRVAFEPLA